jgi:predicted ATP-grasp superfamily ATP-dependent carboligase
MNTALLNDATRRTIREASLPPAVVLGTNITGLAEARPLASHGIPVIGIDEVRRRYTSYSSAWRQVILTDRFNDAGLVELLVRLAAECGRRPALFVSTDEQVKVVAHHGAPLRDCYAFEYPTPETVDLLMSKEAFAGLARERGWPIPATLAAATRQQLEEGMAGLRYPVVLKPRIKTLALRQNTSTKAYRCPDAASLFAAYAEVSPWEPEVVVQEWIPGTDADVHYSFHYFTAGLDELASFEGHKIRQWVPEVGSTASSEPVHPPVVTPLSREILQSTRTAGFCSVEYKRDPRTGTFYITEPTVGRVNLQLGTALANGVDLVSRAYFHLQGLPYPGREARTYDRKWVLLGADYRSARFYIGRGELTWGAWWRSLRGPKSFAVWTPGDTGMWTGALRDLATRVPRALWRRGRRLLGR